MVAPRKKAPIKGGRSGSETRSRAVMMLSVPSAEYTADLDARAAAAGMTRSAYVRAAVEAYGGPEAGTITVSVDAAMLEALSWDGIPPSVRAAFVLREVYGLRSVPTAKEKAAE